MPLLRHALYSQNVNLYLAPTADARDTWLPLMQTVALEGRAFVLSANQCVREKDLPEWIRGSASAASADSSASGEGQGRGVANGAPASPQQPVSGGTGAVAATEGSHELRLPASTSTSSSSSTSSLSSASAAAAATKDTDAPPRPPHQPPAPQDILPASASPSPFVSRGGSAIIHPTGAVRAGPLWEDAGSDEDGTGTLVVSEADFED
ncbi:MAG: hypothetical protein LQ340_007626, partial [Diploschistes diacapsis]